MNFSSKFPKLYGEKRINISLCTAWTIFLCATVECNANSHFIDGNHEIEAISWIYKHKTKITFLGQCYKLKFKKKHFYADHYKLPEISKQLFLYLLTQSIVVELAINCIGTKLSFEPEQKSKILVSETLQDFNKNPYLYCAPNKNSFLYI